MQTVPLLFLALLGFLSCSTHVTSSTDDCDSLWISLTVSPLITTDPPRPLIISWGNAKPQPGDWVGLLNDSKALSSPVSSAAVDDNTGVFNSGEQSPVLNSSKLTFTPQCLGYWAVYVRNNSAVLASTCLGTQPTWMEDMKEELSTRRFSKVFLPGTHDSGSYKQYRKGDVETLVVKYSITQEDDVLTQLILGARYIDLRIGRYPSTQQIWWVNHGLVRMRPLSDVLEIVRIFINNTNEFVILDFQEFPKGFEDGVSTHRLLVDYLREELEYLVASPSLGWSSTLGELWASGNRLILAYDKNEVVSGSTILWKSVEQQWGDKRSVKTLHEFLKQKASRAPSVRPTAAMAQLTPNAWSVITDEFGGLRPMANMVSLNISLWYRGSWGRNTNVVAVDFLSSTSIVDVALLWNRLRARNITCS